MKLNEKTVRKLEEVFSADGSISEACLNANIMSNLKKCPLQRFAEVSGSEEM